MKKIVLALMVMFALFLQTSCTSDADAPATDNPVNVYVAGQKNGKACYWKNNQLVMLDSGNFTSSTYTKKIIVSNGDVYVIGYVYNEPNIPIQLYWKNGVLTNLNTTMNATYLYITDMDVVGNDVYFVGYIKDDLTTAITSQFCYWKNFQKTVLEQKNGYGGYDEDIKVVNNNVYTTDNYNGTSYFINTTKYILTSTTMNANIINGLAIKENQVYAFGSSNLAAFYYNITSNSYTLTGFPNDGGITKMCFDNNDMYYTNGNYLYKNGTQIVSDLYILYDFIVKNNNIYKVGVIQGFASNACVIKINDVTSMTINVNEGSFNSIFVTN